MATHHNPQSAAPRQSDITPESFPGLNAIAQQKFDLPYHELSPSLQSHVREEAVKRAANDLLTALKAVRGLFADGSPFYIGKLGFPITNGDQAHIDSAFLATDAAIALAEGRA